jgi:flavin-dependent dehydrogenase
VVDSLVSASLVAPSMATSFSHDVVVVGAGLAGSSAALALARRGHRVALLDRATFPRPKVCGNCLHPRTWKIWEKLGLAESFRTLPHTDLAGFDIQCEGRPVHRLDFRAQGPRSVSRYVLDDWLLGHARAAGVEVFPGTTVTAVDPDDGTVQTSSGEFRGRLVFGADGRNSVVARLARLMPPPRRCHRIAWQATIDAPPQLDRHVYLQIFEDGYLGYCRFGPDRAVLSLVLDARRSADPGAAARRYLPHLPPLPAEEWLRMSPITRARAQTGRSRVWLVGDSAHVMEPFTGEGMSFALATGLLAAESAVLALAGDQVGTALADYTHKHRTLYTRGAWVNTFTRWILSEPQRLTRLLRHVPFPRSALELLSRQIQLA